MATKPKANHLVPCIPCLATPLWWPFHHYSITYSGQGLPPSYFLRISSSNVYWSTTHLTRDIYQLMGPPSLTQNSNLMNINNFLHNIILSLGCAGRRIDGNAGMKIKLKSVQYWSGILIAVWNRHGKIVLNWSIQSASFQWEDVTIL